jgi:signal transduction histidine kinase
MQKVKHLYEVQDEISSDEVILKDGRSFDRYSAPMLGASGKYYGRVWYFRDITERKQAETVRERLVIELESKNTEMERFIYTVSHDLRSPLVTINGFVGFLQSDLAEGSSGRVEEDLKMISSAISRMEKASQRHAGTFPHWQGRQSSAGSCLHRDCPGGFGSDP